MYVILFLAFVTIMQQVRANASPKIFMMKHIKKVQRLSKNDITFFYSFIKF